jgi:hypothetical protein
MENPGGGGRRGWRRGGSHCVVGGSARLAVGGSVRLAGRGESCVGRAAALAVEGELRRGEVHRFRGGEAPLDHLLEGGAACLQRHGDDSRPGPVSEPAVCEAHQTIRTQGGAEGRVVRVDAEEALGGEGPSEGGAEVAASGHQREEACGGARVHGRREGVYHPGSVVKAQEAR